MPKRQVLLREIESQGIRLTARCRALIETIQASSHLHTEGLLEDVRKRALDIDRTTIYRTLERLKKLGLIDEHDLAHLNGESTPTKSRLSRTTYGSPAFNAPRSWTSPRRHLSAQAGDRREKTSLMYRLSVPRTEAFAASALKES